MGDPVYSSSRMRLRGAVLLLWAVAGFVLASGVWIATRSEGKQVRATAVPLGPKPAAVATPRPTFAPHAPASTTPTPTGRDLAPLPRPSPKPSAGPSYWIRFGPTDDLEGLGEIVDRLAHAYAVVGRIQTRWTVKAYRVTSGPISLRSAAEYRQTLLAAVGLVSTLRPHPRGGYVLDFGELKDAAQAEERARAVRARGFVATVTAVWTPSYTVLVGPLPERVALAMVRSLRDFGIPFRLSHRP